MMKRDKQAVSTVEPNTVADPFSDSHANAALAAAWHALSARCDGRQEDYQFWFRMFESHLPQR